MTDSQGTGLFGWHGPCGGVVKRIDAKYRPDLGVVIVNFIVRDRCDQYGLHLPPKIAQEVVRKIQAVLPEENLQCQTIQTTAQGQLKKPSNSPAQNAENAGM